MNLRTKEITITLSFFGLFVFFGHLGFWFVLFPVNPDTRLFGFPVHYTLALLAGWPVLLLLAAVYARVANRLDDEIASSDGEVEDSPTDTER